MMTKLPLKIGPGQVLTETKVQVLDILGRAGEAGLCAGPMTPGGTLGMLRQWGLAEHMPLPANDCLGGTRTRINEAGREMLKRLGRG
ncbi:hypothetical protein KOAAANKH_00115 [Brevundimonas sp. NIBR10]|uniref:hypothetical protein n=1 Tax=Brevundimonas sp. NIBR10 TaxID=3015997 RepID=UPI0022F1D041|nr:hypothetical protein [Brevundimonas sp. NIBR10]WGM45254.1 hypothetical protein KOAAANKH_00115 [Brevundimonas sp. NIBR10]